MEKKTKITFIVNPKAGITPKSKVIIGLLAGNLLPSRFIAEAVFTEYQGHATLLAAESIKNGSDVIVAVGGDGTINEIAIAMIGTGIPFGILPSGSGNGLARCLGIPMSYALALRTIIKGNTRLIDVAALNDRIFVSIAGVGFDAHVAQKFAGSGIRGLLVYARIILQEFKKYKPARYTITIGGQPVEREAFMISFANSNQFGFHTRIAPQARIDDGMLDICIVRPMKMKSLPRIAYHLFSGTPGKTGYAEYFRANTITLANAGKIPVNLDGEPINESQDINIYIKPLALRVIVP